MAADHHFVRQARGMAADQHFLRQALPIITSCAAPVAREATQSLGDRAKMRNEDGVRGLWCATLTPLDAMGRVDAARMASHAKGLFERGVAGIAPFGTTGEGPSFSATERRAGLEALLDAGISADRLIAATGCAAVTDTIELTRHAQDSGVARCLVMPPFFFNDVPDDALFAFYAGLIDSVADRRLRLYLYHIPQFTGVRVSPAVVSRLATAYPGIVAGVKDSAADWANTAELLERAPQLDILIGHEPDLPRLMRAGGAGTICGVANVYPDVVQRVLAPDTSATDEQRLKQFLDVLFRFPFLPAFKAIKAAQSNDPGWRALRTPWTALPDAASDDLVSSLRSLGFDVGDRWRASDRGLR
jgi:4-hydroxy-tetrahydrodipicolinate synthase